MSREVKYLNIYVQKLLDKFLKACKKEGLDVVVTETFRSVAEQNELYKSGRSKPGKIVTHAKGGQSAHNYGLAFDIVLKKEGKITYEDEKLYEKAGAIGKKIGLEWGGDFKGFRDTPHFQWLGGLKISDLVLGKRPKIPINIVQGK